MSRFMVWILCSLTVLVPLLFGGERADLGVVLTMIGYLGAPLALHWAFEKKEQPQ